MTNQYTIKGKQVTINERTTTFQFPIAQVVEFENSAVVRLDIPAGVINNENVIGLDANGAIVWQVSKRDHVYENSPYVGLKRNEDQIVLFNYDGLRLTLNAKTGLKINEEWGR